MYSKLSESGTCGKLVDLEVKPSTVSTTLESDTREKYMFYVKDEAEVKSKLVMLAKRHDITFRPCSSNNGGIELTSTVPIFHSLQTEHERKIYKSVRDDVLRLAYPDIF